MSQGFADGGIQVVAAFENWNPAIEAYRENFDHPVFKMDLSDVSGISDLLANEYKPDLIIGGPPCQDFSSAGKREEKGRADLTVSFAETIARVKPPYFVMENVQRVTASAAYADARAIFKEAGYGLIEVVLDASYFGAPQRRKRFFCIGGLGEVDNFTDVRIQDLASDKPMTIREYDADSFPADHYYRHPRNYTRRAVFSIDEPAPTMRGVNRPIPGGYPGHSGDSHSLDGSVPALSTAQRAIIQTFPKDFRWPGPKSHVEQLIGNAVPVKLAENVARFLKNHVDQRFEEKLSQFELKAASTAQFADPRSIKDIVSRLRRANKLSPLPLVVTESYLDRLSASEGFAALSSEVKSQLRRAVHMFIQFVDESSAADAA